MIHFVEEVGFELGELCFLSIALLMRPWSLASSGLSARTVSFSPSMVIKAVMASPFNPMMPSIASATMPDSWLRLFQRALAAPFGLVLLGYITIGKGAKSILCLRARSDSLLACRASSFMTVSTALCAHQKLWIRYAGRHIRSVQARWRRAIHVE